MGSSQTIPHFPQPPEPFQLSVTLVQGSHGRHSGAGAQALQRLQELEKIRTKESLTMPVWGNCWTTGMLPGGSGASAQEAALLEQQNQNPVFGGFLMKTLWQIHHPWFCT